MPRRRCLPLLADQADPVARSRARNRSRQCWQHDPRRHNGADLGSSSPRCNSSRPTAQRSPRSGWAPGNCAGRTCARLVEQALKLGYRHIDTAQAYENEREVGEGLRASGTRRDEVFVTTKVWTTHFAPNDLERSAKESLAKLRLSEVDLLLLHWPNPRVPLQETLGALAQCQEARHGQAHRRLELHRGFDRRGGRGLLRSRWCAIRSNTIPISTRPRCWRRARVTAWPWSPTARSRRAASRATETLARIGQTHGKTAAQVCLRWLVQQNVAAIPRTSQIERLSENIDIFDFALSDDEMRQISRMGSAKGRLTDFGFAPKWD